MGDDHEIGDRHRHDGDCVVDRFIVQNASRAGVISRLNFADTHRLGPDYLSSYVKRVMAVTPEDVRRMANQYLTPDKMAVVVVGDEKTVKSQVTEWAQ